MADVEPEYWAIIDGKLYLNLNEKVQKMWNEDQASFIKDADKNWPGVLDK